MLQIGSTDEIAGSIFPAGHDQRGLIRPLPVPTRSWFRREGEGAAGALRLDRDAGRPAAAAAPMARIAVMEMVCPPVHVAPAQVLTCSDAALRKAGPGYSARRPDKSSSCAGEARLARANRRTGARVLCWRRCRACRPCAGAAGPSKGPAGRYAAGRGASRGAADGRGERVAPRPVLPRGALQQPADDLVVPHRQIPATRSQIPMIDSRCLAASASSGPVAGARLQ
jgi:hypothetical protein